MKTLTLSLKSRACCVVLVTACHEYRHDHPEFNPEPMVKTLWNNKQFPEKEKECTFTLDNQTAQDVLNAIIEFKKNHPYVQSLTDHTFYEYYVALLESKEEKDTP